MGTGLRDGSNSTWDLKFGIAKAAQDPPSGHDPPSGLIMTQLVPVNAPTVIFNPQSKDIVFLLSPQGCQPKSFAEYQHSLKMYSATHLPATRAATEKLANHKLGLLPIDEMDHWLLKADMKCYW